MYWTAALDNFMPPGDAWPAVERSLVAAAALNSQLPDSHFGRAIKSFFADWHGQTPIGSGKQPAGCPTMKSSRSCC